MCNWRILVSIIFTKTSARNNLNNTLSLLSISIVDRPTEIRQLGARALKEVSVQVHVFGYFNVHFASLAWRQLEV